MKLMEEYAPRVYGDAASAVTAYLKLADAQYRKTLASGKRLKDGYPPDFYTAEFVEKACGLLSGAMRSPAVPPDYPGQRSDPAPGKPVLTVYPG